MGIVSSLRRLPGGGRLLQILGIAGVPAGGYFGAGWPLGTLLLLYWLETILVTILVSLLIVLHRRLTRKAGHGGGRRNAYLSSFLGVMVPFTLGHGVFVLAFAFLVFPQELGPEAGVSFSALSLGLTAVAVFVLAGFLVDLVGLRRKPFRFVERLAEQAQGRMLVTHLTIIFGAGAMAVFDAPLAFFGVFVALKVLVDLGSLAPEPELEPRPRVGGLVRLLGRWLPKRDGQSFAEHYLEALEEELRDREAKERVEASGEPGA